MKLHIAPLLLLLSAPVIHAQTVNAPTSFDRFMALSTGTGKQTVSFGTNGTPLTSPGVPTITPGPNGVQVGASGSMSNPSGNPVSVNGSGRVPPAAVGKALGNFASKVIGPLAVGVALWDLAKELGFDLTRDTSGALVVKKQDPAICTTAPCFGYYATDFNTGGSDRSIRFSSWGPACARSASNGSAWSVNYNLTVLSSTESTCTLRLTSKSSGEYVGDSPYAQAKEQIAPSPPGAGIPASIQELEVAIAAKSGWPTTSAVGRALVDATNVSGEKLPVESVIVTGPATSTGAITTTNNTTNNTTKTDTVTHNHIYEGAVVTTNTTTTSNTVNNSTGAVTDNSTTTSTAVPPLPPEPIKVCGLPNTPACKIDETGTPSGVGTTYDGAKTAIDTAKTSAETNITGAASIAAPAWSFSFALPTGCAPYVTGIKGVVLNVCQYQPTIHGLLSVIWAAATAFAMIGMVGRTIREA